MKKHPLELAPLTLDADKYTDFDLAILNAVHSLRFGSVEVTVHDSTVVQIECKEKIRFQPVKKQTKGAQ
jgi:hypothetical protein